MKKYLPHLLILACLIVIIIELSLRTWTILGGVSTVGILLLAVWLAKDIVKLKIRAAIRI